jgi:hypothetical protein
MRGGKRVCPAGASGFCIEEIEPVACLTLGVTLRIGRKRPPPPENAATRMPLGGLRLRKVPGSTFRETA